MENLFSDYKKLLNQRLDTKPLLLIGEDSIRYDFFYALTSNGVSSFEIEVEVPMDENCFIPRKNPIALRKEKPQIDLLVKSEKTTDCC